MKVRCLVVDDNTDFGEAARDLLEREGISVVGIAASGDDALERAEALRPELALVDINLGDESGFEVARRLATQRDAPAVILISTDEPQEFEMMIEDSPAVGFLTKTDLSAAAINRLLPGVD